MDERLKQLEIHSLGDCTIREITEQWNTGFKEYFNDMTLSIETMNHRLGKLNIQPELSVAAYIEGVPAGFVMIGMAHAGGRRLAWNGGTGVNPAFRGLSLSKVLLQEAIRRTKAAGADSLSLETRTDNERAIRSYLGVGFRIRETLQIMSREGAFTSMPFMRSHSADYRTVPVTPDSTGSLAFYPDTGHSWTTEWFNAEGREASVVLDHRGVTVGYVIYRKSIRADGTIECVELTQCEADPQRSDRRDIVRHLLNEVFTPLSGPYLRRVHYLRESNDAAMDALREAGFQTVFAEHLMVLDFQSK
ncbi:GNAT family N-acetyltransferase [Paenibacillus spongiae]|uniref:GNAT family N-acetyltransferase n=1 Tax=Paenibacillus spongiae TaxID=2909671 RepID=A0ABY5SHA8_9BACL|nr:GNAT family N-acetyltransferase [Paenibacillus spongiae]UVI33044.1 GNAT family N-acetyltransferase [Paenibacillus spongiae]